MQIYSRLLLGVSLLCVSASTAASETIVYKYDELGRLIRTTQSGSVNNGVTTDLAYDKAGNRTDYDVTGSNGSGSGSGVTGSGGTGAGALPAFSISDASATEGGSLTFTVTKSFATSINYSVSWASANGSAVAGSDYTAGAATLTFGPSDLTKTIIIPTIDNNLYEQGETFYVNLTGISGGATISDNQGAGTISDNDTPNTPPVANNDVGIISCSARSFLPMLNDIDADGDALVLAGSAGSLSSSVQGNHLYVSGTTNPGTYQINYSIHDTRGGTASATLTLTWVTEESCPDGGNNNGGPAQ